MSQIDPELVTELVNLARPHYSEDLPYHNWEHAIEGVSLVQRVARRSINPYVANNADLMAIIFGWHNSGYRPIETEYPTREHRSAALFEQHLPKLSSHARAVGARAILDTHIDVWPKSDVLGEAVTTFKYGYLQEAHPHSLQRLDLIRREWGVDWETAIARTLSFGESIVPQIDESVHKIFDKDEADAWTARVKANLKQFEVDLNEGTLPKAA